MTINEKLDNFYVSVIDHATAKSVEIIEEYKESLNKLKKERVEAALAKAQNTYKVETDYIYREKNRKLSQDSIALKRKVLDRTIELTENIYKEVEHKLVEFMNTPEYKNYVIQKIKDATHFAKEDEIIIYINPSDEKLIPELKEELNVNLKLSDRDFLGGIRAVIPSRTILIDYSFLTKLEESKNNFTLI